MCLPNIMNLLCISPCCHQYFCDFYPLHHFTHWCQLLGTLSVTSSLSSSVFIHVLPRCHSGSARIFTFLLRHLMALYSIGQEFQFLLRVQGNNFICNDFLCCFFCAQQHCLDIAHVKFPLAFCAEFWRPIPVSFLSKFNSVLPILLFILAIT